MSASLSNVKVNGNIKSEVPEEKLYAQIGKFKLELYFLKKV
jgi:hypothetical protein